VGSTGLTCSGVIFDIISCAIFIISGSIIVAGGEFWMGERPGR
jgi:hypothetical protein